MGGVLSPRRPRGNWVTVPRWVTPLPSSARPSWLRTSQLVVFCCCWPRGTNAGDVGSPTETRKKRIESLAAPPWIPPRNKAICRATIAVTLQHCNALQNTHGGNRRPMSAASFVSWRRTFGLGEDGQVRQGPADVSADVTGSQYSKLDTPLEYQWHFTDVAPTHWKSLAPCASSHFLESLSFA